MDGERTQNLVERALAGDDRARELLYGRCLPPLQRWAKGRLPVWARSQLDTNDIVQDTVVRSLRSLGHLDVRRPGALLTYLRTGVRNRIVDEIRRTARKPELKETLSGVEDPVASPVDQAIGKESLARYRRALNNLAPVERDAVVARVEMGCGYQEIALLLGKSSPDAARMTVKRCLLRLAKDMARHE